MLSSGTYKFMQYLVCNNVIIVEACLHTYVTVSAKACIDNRNYACYKKYFMCRV